MQYKEVSSHASASDEERRSRDEDEAASPGAASSGGSQEGSDEEEISRSVSSASAREIGLIGSLPQPRLTPGAPRAIGVFIGLVALTAYAATHVSEIPPPGGALAQVQHFADTISARMLLESPELAAIGADQLMAAGQRHGGLTHADRSMVHTVTKYGFGNISRSLHVRNPELAQQLDSVRLSPQQRDAVLGVVRHMSDLRVQNIGVQIATVLREFMNTTEDRDGVKVRILKTLNPKLTEIRRLRDEVLPEALRGSGSAPGSHGLRVTLNPERMRIVKTFTDGWKLEYSMSAPARLSQQTQRRRLRGGADAATHEDDQGKRFAIAGGVVEQARVVLVLFKEILGKGGQNFEVPSWVTSLDGHKAPFISDLIMCVHDSFGDLAHMIGCPMKFASAGLDVFSSID
mmetsp:Transcript_125091/g.324948  ORF Transcript_125091/g.324948 Transcript_125091/m.324948 type:complete len:403 (-) Transcript_125091:257-1465(-)